MNDLERIGNFVLHLFIFLSFVYMLKSSMGINFVQNCHAEEILLGNCKSSVPTIIDKMYETYQFITD